MLLLPHVRIIFKFQPLDRQKRMNWRGQQILNIRVILTNPAPGKKHSWNCASDYCAHVHPWTPGAPGMTKYFSHLHPPALDPATEFLLVLGLLLMARINWSFLDLSSNSESHISIRKILNTGSVLCPDRWVHAQLWGTKHSLFSETSLKHFILQFLAKLNAPDLIYSKVSGFLAHSAEKWQFLS